MRFKDLPRSNGRSEAVLLALGVFAAMVGCAAAPESKPPNVVVVVVDMLRADHLPSYGYAKDTAPNLARMADNGVVFERAYAPAPWTYPSVVSMLTGVPPSSHGATRDLEAGTLVDVGDPALWLPPKFAEHGYRTVAFHTHPYLRESASSVSHAFQEYRDPAAEASERTGRRHVAEMFLGVLYPPAAQWIRDNGTSPFFMYLHVIDVHGPYAQPLVLSADRERLGDALPDILDAHPRMADTGFFRPTDIENEHKDLLYDGHIAEVDRYLGSLQALLDEMSIADNTVVVVTSDHGEGFGEDGDWGHGRSLEEYAIRVPLVVTSYAGLHAGTRVSSAVSLTDLLPSMMDLAEIPLEDEIGREPGFADLLLEGAVEGEVARAPIWSETDRGPGLDALLLRDRWKLITDHTTGDFVVSDLVADLDGPPPNAVTAELHAARAALLRRMISHATRHRGLDNEALQDLRALGYVR